MVGGQTATSSTFSVSTLPTGWSDADVGAVGVAGSASYASGVFTVKGGGTQINGTADAMNFAYQPLSGDGSILARVASVTGASGAGTAGVMIRETMDPGSTNGETAEYPWYSTIYFDFRVSTGGNSAAPGSLGGVVPYWMKVARSGNTFSGYTSTDGRSWVQLGASQTINMAQNVYLGLAVNSGGTTSLATATFDNVSTNSAASPAPFISSLSATTGSIGSTVAINGTGFGPAQSGSLVTLNGAAMTVNSWSATAIYVTIPAGATSGAFVVTVAPTMNTSNRVIFTVTTQPLPSPWLDQDVGAVGATGSATYTNGVFTVNGAGLQVNGTADAMHFVYQPLSGDGTILARVVSTQGANNSATAGVMIRETMDPGSANADTAEYPGYSLIYYDVRTTPGGNSSSPGYIGGGLPYWMKVVRSGSTFSGYTSADGQYWSQLGTSQTINMAQNVYIGLAMNSGFASLGTGTFDNVTVIAGAGPVIASLSPSAGGIGRVVTIAGTSFGATQGTSTVKFNGTVATPTNWGDTSIVVPVPAGATSGSVVVTVGGVASNAPQFTVYPNPGITSFTPGSGLTGTSVTVTGTNLGTTQGASTLSFNGTNANTMSSWSDTQIVALVPSGATSGTIAVVVNGISGVSGSSFLINNPIINSVSPPAAGPGGTITLIGTGFGATQGASQVQFNNDSSLTGTVVSWSDTSIRVTIPANAPTGPAVVRVIANGLTSADAQFTISVLAVSSYDPPGGPVGITVAIIGSGFGATQTDSTVSFNGLSATVTAWGDTEIDAVVPAGTTNGPVSVQVAGITKQGTVFLVNSIAQLTDSRGFTSSYTSELIGGVWYASSSQGSGCSSCTLRGAVNYTYDGSGNVLSRTDELGRTTTYTYDGSNNVMSISAPVGPSTYATTSYTYNSFGEVLTATDPLGKMTSNVYDANGNLLTVTAPAPGGGPAASVTHFAYDVKGELTTITDPLSNATTLTYTTAGLIATITDAQNKVTTYQYDAHGNRTLVQDALNNQTTFAYDAADRLTTITYLGGATTTFGYDVRGRRTSVTDQNAKTTSYVYDDADRLLTVTDAANNVTTYSYDTENNLLSIKDANNHTTGFAYDSFGRVTQTNFPAGTAESYGYDAVGNLLSKTDRKSQTVSYSYDQGNRLTQKAYPDSSAVTYSYDTASRLTQVSDPTGTYQFTFDNMGRLKTTTTNYAFLTGRSFTTGYAYDAGSNRTGFTDPENGTSSYVYDNLNRLASQASPQGTFGFAYDALSRRTSLTRPNTVNTTYGYDQLSRLLSVVHQKAGVTQDGATYTVDAAGNRTSKGDLQANVTSNYTYDAIYQLTKTMQGASTTETYGYDPVGNRLNSLGVSSYTSNTANELTATSNASYTYDNNGNTLTKSDGTGTTTYTWDFENRLTSVVLPGSGGTVSFKYDPFGRRIYKNSTSGTSLFAYDDDNLIEETNGTGAVVARYTHGLSIDEPLAMTRAGATSYYHADGLGSITSLSNSTGASSATYTFDAFGNLTAFTGSLTNPFMYTARELDAETGLYYYRARYYDSQTGRFIGEDPAGFDGGGNFYAYVGNDPADYFDPFGLARSKQKKKPQKPPDTCPRKEMFL